MGIATLIIAVTAGVIATGAYLETRQQTVEARRQAKASEDALELIRQDFIADERPIIWLTNDAPGIALIQPSGQIVWNYYYTNYGKTPANRVRAMPYYAHL
ncbi:MAG: hypothetical protein ABSE67_07350 [Xanthobacteraceae bacterium]